MESWKLSSWPSVQLPVTLSTSNMEAIRAWRPLGPLVYAGW